MHVNLSVAEVFWSRSLAFARRLPSRAKAGLRSVLTRRVRRTRPSLVNRLSAFLLMGTIFISLMSVAALYFTTSELIEDTLRKQAVQWLAEMEELGTPLYYSRNPDVLALEKRVHNVEEISYVRYYDSSGEELLGLFGDFESAPLLQSLGETMVKRLSHIARSDTPFLLESGFDGGRHVHVLSAVRVRTLKSDGLLDFNISEAREETKVIGFVDLAIDSHPYRAQLLRSVGIGSLLTALVLLVTIIVGRRLIGKALRPLTDLQTPLARLAKGEIDVSVSTGGDSEFVGIANALNVTIGALKERNEALHRLAERDALTGLYNRNYFSRILDAELAWVKRGRMTSALLFIDLDRFKYVNDTLGHGAGDRLLVEVADLIKSRMRGHDVVARFGGDEFTVVTHDVAKRDALIIAKNVHDILLDYRFVDQKQSFTISCTIGIAMITVKSRSTEEVLSQADAACYEAKSAGRNQFVLYEPDRQQLETTETDVGWSKLIKDAIKEDRFELYYQPIVRVDGGGPEFYEVLLRLPDRRGKIFMPGVFLPIAERFGLLSDIDRWVVTHALKALARFRESGRDVQFSINLSGQAMADPAMIEHITNALRDNAVPASAVVLEITEQTAVRYLDRARSLTQGLIDLGCRFALDDFGVGFSSFSYLKRLPVSLVKIDGSFIKNLVSEPIDQVMVKSIVEIARVLGKQVVAEFVQDATTVELLKSFGVDYVQGSHLGRPAEDLPHHPTSLADVQHHQRSRRRRAAS